MRVSWDKRLTTQWHRHLTFPLRLTRGPAPATYRARALAWHPVMNPGAMVALHSTAEGLQLHPRSPYSVQFDRTFQNPRHGHLACNSLLFLPSLNGSLQIGQSYRHAYHQAPLRALQVSHTGKYNPPAEHLRWWPWDPTRATPQLLCSTPEVRKQTDHPIAWLGLWLSVLEASLRRAGHGKARNIPKPLTCPPAQSGSE